ncbi:MAG: PQQ-like beta-propeller repeat protein [Planctomycetes bacterium]|nr:PQQ-like beta-propeller repeat protein [Planctomycetota bacterium]
MRLSRTSACLLASAAVLSAAVRAADWPGWRGADRTGVSAETGLLQRWPEGGPKLLWKATGLGGGYSTPSVAGSRLFVMGSKGEEFVRAFDVKDGTLLWSTKVGAVGENTGPSYPGPRATPTIDGDVLYTLGSDGDLVCAAVDTGKVRWHHHLEKEFDGNRGTWAYTESPLVDGDTLVCTPGGETATLLALDKKDGKVRWKAVVPGGNQAGYASAVVATTGDVKQYVQFLGSGVVGVAAKDGRFLWRYNRNVGGVSAATPIVHDGLVFATSSATAGDAGGDALLRLTARVGKVEAREVYLKRSIVNFHGGVVRIGDHLYGTNNTGLVCAEFRTGARTWLHRSVGRGALVAAGGHLYLRSERGAVALVEATPAGYREKGRFEQPFRSRYPTFAHPVVANGRLYLRDADVLLCYDVKEK